MTKTPDHPQGISHDDFVSALERHWDHGFSDEVMGAYRNAMWAKQREKYR